MHTCTFVIIQEPQEIKIGDPYHEPVFTGTKRQLIERQDSYQYISLLASLKSLLSDSSIMDEVEQCPLRVRSDGLIDDY